MDFFDVISVFGETYVNAKKDMDRNIDPIEVIANNFGKTKRKIDKMYDDEMREFDTKRKKR